MRYYLFCFDISNDKARYRVANILSDYGERVQESVFEVALKSHTSVQVIMDKIQLIVDPLTDDVRYYYLSDESLRRSMTLTGAKIKQVPSVIIV